MNHFKDLQSQQQNYSKGSWKQTVDFFSKRESQFEQDFISESSFYQQQQEEISQKTAINLSETIQRLYKEYQSQIKNNLNLQNDLMVQNQEIKDLQKINQENIYQNQIFQQKIQSLNKITDDHINQIQSLLKQNNSLKQELNIRKQNHIDLQKKLFHLECIQNNTDIEQIIEKLPKNSHKRSHSENQSANEKLNYTILNNIFEVKNSTELIQKSQQLLQQIQIYDKFHQCLQNAIKQCDQEKFSQDLGLKESWKWIKSIIEKYIKLKYQNENKLNGQINENSQNKTIRFLKTLLLVKNDNEIIHKVSIIIQEHTEMAMVLLNNNLYHHYYHYK